MSPTHPNHACAGAPLPADESARVAALHATRLLDSEPDDLFDRVVRIVCAVLDVPAGDTTSSRGACVLVAIVGRPGLDVMADGCFEMQGFYFGRPAAAADCPRAARFTVDPPPERDR